MKPQTGKTDSSRVKLQRVEKTGLSEIVHMAETVWRQHFPGIISDEQIEYMLAKFYSLEAVSEELEGGGIEYCFIVHDGERVGFCAFGVSKDHGSKDHESKDHGSRDHVSKDHGVMKLHKLYVLPRFQRQGLGSQAMHCNEKRCREQGCSTIILAVNKRNGGAIRAYVSGGFTIDQSVTVDIGGGFFMDDYIMKKRLKQGPQTENALSDRD